MKHAFQEIIPIPERRALLPRRRHGYQFRLGRGRFLAYSKPIDTPTRWLAVGYFNGRYAQHCFGTPDDPGILPLGRAIMTFSQAKQSASEWFEEPAQVARLPEANPYRQDGSLCFCPIGKEHTVGHALHEYFEWCRAASKAEKSTDIAICVANQRIVPLLASKPTSDLVPEDFRALLKTLSTVPRDRIGFQQPDLAAFGMLSGEQQRKKRYYANYTLNLLRSALNRAWSDGKIGDNRAWRDIKTYKVGAPPPTFIPTSEQLRVLIEKSPPDLRKLICFGLLTGCSLGELVSFRWNWLDLNKRCADVPACGKSVPRRITLSDQAINLVRTFAGSPDPNDFLFPRDDGSQRNPKGTADKFLVVRRRAGLPRGFSLGTLRDVYAHRLLSHGVSSPVVARQLGRSISSVVRRYGRLTDDFIDEDLRKHLPASFAYSLEKHQS